MWLLKDIKKKNKELKRRSGKDLKTHGNQKDIVKN
jgi:hypothetical protein